MLRIRVERVPNCTILTCVGRMVAGEECRLLWSTVLSEEAREVILDCTAVSGMDAAGLGTVVALHNKLAEKNVSLTLFNVESRIRALLALTHLDRVLNLRQNVNPEAQVHSRLAIDMPANFLGSDPLGPPPSSQQNEF